MKSIIASLIAAAFIVCGVHSAFAAKPIDFAHDVVPILQKHCAECHAGDKAEGGFSMNTRSLMLEADAAVPGKPAESRMIELIESNDAEDQMPPKDLPRLAAGDVAILKQWVTEGLKWEGGFSFAGDRYEPPLLPRKPKLPGSDESVNPIDRIIFAHYADYDLALPEPLDDGAFARRLYLDVVGLIPHGESQFAESQAKQSEELLAADSLDREALVDHVLSLDRLYAEHWMTFWNDGLRNAYSGTGYIDGGRSQITPWLYRSLLENKPYDQFVRELISPTNESRGFIAGIKWRGNVNASQTREVQFAQSISQTLLGVNMKCASCHDSFIDRWKLDEAYGLAAIYSDKPLEIYRCDKPTGRTATASWIFPELGNVDPKSPRDERLKKLAGLMTDPRNGRLSRTIVNRLWNNFMGRGIVHPVDAMHTEPWSADLLDYLAVYLVEQDYDLKAVMRLIATSKAYQSQAVVLPATPEGKFVFQGPVMKRMTSEQFLDSVWSVTHAWPKPAGSALKPAGRGQGGQLAAVMAAHANQKVWGDRPVRAVFTPNDALQAGLGRPNREQIVTSRPDQLTTLEAIYLANGDEFATIVKKGAGYLLSQPEATSDSIIDSTYRQTLSRPPSEEERTIARNILGEKPSPESVEDFLWTLFLLPEFQFIR